VAKGTGNVDGVRAACPNACARHTHVTHGDKGSTEPGRGGRGGDNGARFTCPNGRTVQIARQTTNGQGILGQRILRPFVSISFVYFFLSLFLSLSLSL